MIIHSAAHIDYYEAFDQISNPVQASEAVLRKIQALLVDVDATKQVTISSAWFRERLSSGGRTRKTKGHLLRLYPVGYGWAPYSHRLQVYVDSLDSPCTHFLVRVV